MSKTREARMSERERELAEAYANRWEIECELKYSPEQIRVLLHDAFLAGRASAREEIERLKRLLDRVEEALVIYANPARYIENYRKQLDGGEKAREVLAAIREGRE